MSGVSTALLIAGTLLLSAQERKDLTEAGAVPEVRLEPHEGRTQFHLGDPIELDLVFLNSTPDQYSVNATGYPDLVDQVEVTPARGWVHWQGQGGHDYLSEEPLNEKEIRIPIALNEGFVFREARHYEVRVTTGRLLRGSSNNTRGYGPVTTNALGIDLVPLPEDLEAAMVRNLMAQITSADMRTRSGREAHHGAIARLAALQGDDAMRAKISLILEQDDDMRGATREALATTRNLPLQLSLLEAAWNDPQRPPIYDMPVALQETRALLRGEMLQGWTMSVGGSKGDEGGPSG